jgi:hypothetical protein
MRREASGLRDRVLAAIEITALGIWLGALIGFAFIFAPLAFRLVAPLDIGRFAALTASALTALTQWGYALGGIAILVALARAIDAGDRTWDVVRAALVAIALGLAAYEQQTIVPAMQATSDLRGAEYHALHQRSSTIYGGAVLLALAALVLAAARREA